MNTKVTKSIIGVTLAIIMIASIFAAIAPATTADVAPAAELTQGKTGPSTVPAIAGNVINFTISVGNPVQAAGSWTGRVYDVPSGADPFDTVNKVGWVELTTAPVTLPANGVSQNWYYEHTITASDVANGSVDNKMAAIGQHNDGTWTNGTAQHVTTLESQEIPPEFSFEFEGIGCHEVELNGSASVDPDGSIVNHTWYFGDGDSQWVDGAPGTITHTYATGGVKTVKLEGYDDGGNYNSTTDVIYVDQGPTAIARANPSCFEGTGSMVTFNGSSSHADLANELYPQSIATYNWTFDDGQTGSSDNAAVTSRMVNDTVTATLTVTDTLGCVDTDTVTVGPCSLCNIRIYGTYGEGAGNDEVTDPVTGLYPENWPYTDPIAPFYPQHEQAPRKDFITFNPAIMAHNNDPLYEELDFIECDGDVVQSPAEKVFKRMWYEKELFKDYVNNGEWDVVTDEGVMTLREWFALDQWDRPAIREWNSPDAPGWNPDADIYGPAIVQEFTYMTLDQDWQPILVKDGSELLIPMAHDPVDPYRGLNSFDADLDGTWDFVRVESEASLGVDIDGDTVIEPMDGDLLELSGNESVVFVLGPKRMNTGTNLQFFDHVVMLETVDVADGEAWVWFRVEDNEGGGSVRGSDVVLKPGTDDTAFFYRAKDPATGERAAFYLKVISANYDTQEATVEVGRMFGQTYANIEVNEYRAQKMFIVDEVFYNVVAIKAQDDCFKYITIRQKLPKTPIKIFGKHLKVWTTEEVLPELSPFNLDHEILPDINPIDPEDPPYPIVKVPSEAEKVPMPPLEIIYVDETVEPRYKGELKEIYAENSSANPSEFWTLEWYWTLPWQYTEFRLPKGDKYLVTLSWRAEEAETTLWDGGEETDPVWNKKIDRFKFWYEDCTGPLYIDRATSSIRLYGTFGEGAGDQTATDVETQADSYGYEPENKPYTDPEGPFFPQHDQAPVKDFMTFNPAIMDHNQGYPELDFVECEGYIVQTPKEKVFKRMWYEKEWFKDYDGAMTDGAWDVVVEKYNPTTEKWEFEEVITLAEWNAKPDYQKIIDMERLREWNCPDQPGWVETADIYGPAINQEFTYMTVNQDTMPIMVQAGSEILIPLAHDTLDPYRGLNSFDADGDGVRDPVRVESEQTIGINVDDDALPLEPMNNDTTELNGDEQVVFVLGPKKLTKGTTLQFFDHRVQLDSVDQADGTYSVWFTVQDNEGGASVRSTNVGPMVMGDVVKLYRAKDPGAGEKPAFYIKLLSADYGRQEVRVEVGRMFGQTHANIEFNEYRAQKMFIVDEVFYNVVAVKTEDNCFKYITIRQKLPKTPIKIFGKHLKVWTEGEMLPEMSPFNQLHEILVDVQPGWGAIPASQQAKIGPKVPRPPLEISYVAEDEEWRFLGELKEIYNETWDESTGIENEFWNVEWFHTKPQQYTAFVLPEGELYLMTLAWYAPEAEITVWDHNPDGPYDSYTDGRVKFWYDAADNTDIYINRVGDIPEEDVTITDYYNMASNGGDGIAWISSDEVINAVMDYLTDAGPFAPGTDPHFVKDDLLNYVMAYLAQPTI
jgi:hypothetical protein